jgi:hypothetical protein
MLRRHDASTRVDREVERMVAAWTGEGPREPAPDYTGTQSRAESLRALMESSGRTGLVQTVTLDGQPAFIYSCRESSRKPFAQGVGDTAALAICDAFLHCCPEPLRSLRDHATSSTPAT